LLTEPDRNGRYRLSTRLTLAQQAVPLTVLADADVVTLEVIVNGHVRTLGRPFKTVLPVVPGEFQVEVRGYDTGGQLRGTDSLRFYVEPGEAP
jgi:hypothetical protein